MDDGVGAGDTPRARNQTFEEFRARRSGPKSFWWPIFALEDAVIASTSTGFAAVTEAICARMAYETHGLYDPEL